jgi:hypothetical protein
VFDAREIDRGALAGERGLCRAAVDLHAADAQAALQWLQFQWQPWSSKASKKKKMFEEYFEKCYSTSDPLKPHGILAFHE